MRAFSSTQIANRSSFRSSIRGSQMMRNHMRKYQAILMIASSCALPHLLVLL